MNGFGSPNQDTCWYSNKPINFQRKIPVAGAQCRKTRVTTMIGIASLTQADIKMSQYYISEKLCVN